MDKEEKEILKDQKENDSTITDDSVTVASILGEIKSTEALDPEVEEQLASIAGDIDSVEAKDVDNQEIIPEDVIKDKLEEVKKFLPGLSSPTVMPLYNDENNFVIHVVVDSDEVFDAIDNLKKIGGGGILVLSINQMVK